MRLYILIFAAILATACGKKETAKIVSVEPIDLDAIYVKTAPITSGNGTLPIVASGIVTTGNEAKPSFKTGGVIATALVKEGDSVQKGQLLATLNLTEINAYLQQAQEGVAKAERDQIRVKNLLADSVATLEQLQNVTSGLEIARRTLEIAKFNVAYSEARSPISGKVIKQIQRAGEVVGPGMPIYYILGLGNADWKISVGLSDKDWARTRVGDAATVRMDAFPGQVFAAKVTRVADVGNPMSGTFDVEVKLSNPPKMAAGLVTNVEIKPSKSGTYVLLPIETLASSDGPNGVVFVAENGIARKKNVTIVQLLGDKVAIGSGLEGVTEVVSAGVGFLKDGDKIVVNK